MQIDLERCHLLVPKDRAGNLRWRRKLFLAGQNDAVARQQIWTACKHNVLFFINSFCYIMETRTARILPFITHPTQDRVLAGLRDNLGKKDVLIPKGRDEGISTTGMAFVLWRFLFYDKQSILLVSRVEDLVYDRENPDALFSKIDFMWQRVPPWLRDPETTYVRLHMGSRMFENSIDGVSSAANTGTGRRKLFIWFDEYAKVDEAFKIYNDTATVSNSRFFCSTHVGTGTKFYQLSRVAEEEEKAKVPYAKRSIIQVKTHWLDNPLHAKDKYYDPTWTWGWRSPWYDKMCAGMGNNKGVIAQELEIDPQRADTQFFDGELVQRVKAGCRPPDAVGDVMNFNGSPRWENKLDGKFKLWMKMDYGRPPSHETFAIGIDIATGAGATPSCMSVVSCLTGKKVASFASATILIHKFAELAVLTARWFNNAFICWEKQGPGTQFGPHIMNSGYRNIYWKKANPKSVKEKVSDIPGWQNSPDDFRAGLEQYAFALLTGKYSNYDLESVTEMQSFVLTPAGRVVYAPAQAAENVADARENHGDRVVADMLSWKMAAENPQGVQVEAVDEYTVSRRRYEGQVRRKLVDEDGDFGYASEQSGDFA